MDRVVSTICAFEGYGTHIRGLRAENSFIPIPTTDRPSIPTLSSPYFSDASVMTGSFASYDSSYLLFGI
jgi:hypothetical protein